MMKAAQLAWLPQAGQQDARGGLTHRHRRAGPVESQKSQRHCTVPFSTYSPLNLQVRMLLLCQLVPVFGSENVRPCSLRLRAGRDSSSQARIHPTVALMSGNLPHPGTILSSQMTLFNDKQFLAHHVSGCCLPSLNRELRVERGSCPCHASGPASIARTNTDADL